MTWHNITSDQRVQIARMRRWQPYPGMPFNQQMTVPLELTLHLTGADPRLRMNPIRELETLRTKMHGWTDLTLK